MKRLVDKARLLGLVLLFPPLWLAAMWLLALLPHAGLWAGLPALLTFGQLHLTWMHAVQALLGWALFVYGAWHTLKITVELRSIRDPQTRQAQRLLENGHYAQVRHPMYGSWIMAETGLFTALGSWYSLVALALILPLITLNGVVEERYDLLPRFGEAYRAYAQRVRRRYFTPLQWTMVAICLGLTVLGAFF